MSDSFEIVTDDVVDHMLRNFQGEFDAALRKRLPTLDDAARIEPLGKDPWRFDIDIEADDRTWEVVSHLEQKENRLVVLGAYPKMTEFPQLTHEEAVAFIDAELREGPSEGMTGVEYVESIRPIWKGLLPSDQHDA